MTDDTNIPKQELLIKLLRMTTSDNDGEALTALRKANALMTAAGWDWERLINSKIKIVASPFANLATPPSDRRSGNNGGSGGATTPPFSPNPGRQWQNNPKPPPQPTPPPVSKTTHPIGIDPNRFAGPCYCCGIEVVANAGLLFRPNKYHTRATSDWKVVCTSCNTTATIGPNPAPRQRGRRAAVSDLA